MAAHTVFPDARPACRDDMLAASCYGVMTPCCGAYLVASRSLLRRTI